MRIYLAARYSRRLEMCGYRDQLNAIGHTVEAVWLNGGHQIDYAGVPIAESVERLVELASSIGEYEASLRARFAQDDYRDVLSCDLLIAFTEPPRSSLSRGGRHVEFGIALGMGKLVWVVGHRENIFHWLGDVEFFETWEMALANLSDGLSEIEER